MKKSPLLVRLPLIVALLLGAWLWNGGLGLLPTERELTWKLGGAYGTIRKIELQVWDGDELLLREERSYTGGVTADPQQKLSLKRGEYTAKAVVWRQGAMEPTAWSSTFYVQDEKAVAVADE